MSEKRKTVGIGMLGYGMMGRFHSSAFTRLSTVYSALPASPRLVSMCGIPEATVKVESERYGYSKYCTDWMELIKDDEVDLIDIGAPNDLHEEVCLRAAEAKKHVICEKPLARDAKEAKRMLDAVQSAGVVHVCDFNYRLVPALVLAKQIIDSGRLGTIRHFRANYLQDWPIDPEFPLVWRFVREKTGTGALGDFSHIVDLARWFCGEPESVFGTMKTFIEQRPLLSDPARKGQVDVDDAFVSIIEFSNGALGTLEGSRMCPGRKNFMTIEINGSKGSIYFDLEQMNYLQVYIPEEQGSQTLGFQRVNVTAPDHPYGKVWGPYGMEIGWENLYIHMAYHTLEAIVNEIPVSPVFADFVDGYRATVICDAIEESSREGRRVEILY